MAARTEGERLCEEFDGAARECAYALRHLFEAGELRGLKGESQVRVEEALEKWKQARVAYLGQ